MKKFYTVLSLLGFFFLLSSCSRKMSFATSTVVPAATGKVKIKKDNNNNYKIEVNVTNLADSKDLAPSRNIYLVWMETDNMVAKKLGQIKTSSSLFSKTRKGSFETIALTKPNVIFITAEDDEEVRYPGLQVLTTKK